MSTALFLVDGVMSDFKFPLFIFLCYEFFTVCLCYFQKQTGKFFKNYKVVWDVPGGAVVKNPPANAGDTGSSPDPGRSLMPQSN